MSNNKEKCEDRVIDKETVARFLPKSSTIRVTDELVAELNQYVISDKDISSEFLKEKSLAYMHLLEGRGHSVKQLVNAIKFSHYRNIEGMTNKKAYELTFPDRYARLVEEGKQVDSRVTGYLAGELVQEVAKLMIMPAHLVALPYQMFSIQKTYEIANGISSSGKPVSPMVEMTAAKNLWEMTKMPEDNTIQMKVGVDDDTKSMQKSFVEAIKANTAMQMERLRAGESIKDVQKIGGSIIDAEVV